jgi:hypothetical protein
LTAEHAETAGPSRFGGFCERCGSCLTVLTANPGFVIGAPGAVHVRARRYAQRQRTPTGTSVALKCRNSFPQGATMFTAIGFIAIVGIAFGWIKLRHKRKAENAGL